MAIFVFLLLLINLTWTILLYLEPSHTTFWNYLYNISYGLNFAISSYLAFSYSNKLSTYANSLRFFALGFGSFFLAQLVWVYYNLILSAEVPYPSLADGFWLLFYPLIAIAFAKLLSSLNTPLKLSSVLEIIFIGTFIFAIIASFLNLNEAQLGLPLLTQTLNYLYPICDSLMIALAITTLHSQAGRLQTNLLFFIAGFLTLSLGDTLFAYQAAQGSYWNGNFVDLCYALSGFLLTMGIISLPKLLSDAAHTTPVGTASRV